MHHKVNHSFTPHPHTLPMRHLLALRRRWPLLSLLTLYAYLAVHTLSGAGGLASWSSYEAEAERLASDLSTLQAERARLNARASRLSSRSLDLDALDIAARRALYASQETELVIPIHD